MHPGAAAGALRRTPNRWGAPHRPQYPGGTMAEHYDPQAIHRPFDSFHLTVARGAIRPSRVPDVANQQKGYAKGGYVEWTQQKALAVNLS